VRVVELSNHPDAMLREARQHRAPGRAGRRHAAGATLARHQTRVAEAQGRRDQARAARQWLAWMRGVLAVWRELRSAPAHSAAPGRGSDREAVLQAGVAGEQSAETALGRVFGDGWVMLRGYRNQAGEIDQLLLGPRGLIAIEVKNLNATVHCDGDHWRADKYDKYGNLVDQHPIADRGGRSPGRQLNEPADALEQYLHSRGHPVPIQRVVLLTHPRSRIGNCRSAGVRITTSARDIGQLARDSGIALDPVQAGAIEYLIVGDHRRGEARRRPRS
jgi:Nuclease-related domain